MPNNLHQNFMPHGFFGSDLFTFPDKIKISINKNIVAEIHNYIFHDIKSPSKVFHKEIPISFLYKLHVYILTSQYKNYEFIASGVDINKQLALTKCYFEYLERLSFFSSEDLHFKEIDISTGNIGETHDLSTHTTNGFSAYDNINSAVLNALTELVERDSILYHWFSKKTPVRVINTNSVDYLAINRYLKKHDIEIEVYELSTYEPFINFLLLFHVNKYDIINVTFSSHINKNNAMRKALHEGLKELDRIINEKDYISSKYIETLSNAPDPMDHAYYYYNPLKKEAFRFIRQTKFEKDYSSIKSSEIENPNAIFNNLKAKYNLEFKIYLAPLLSRFSNNYICVKALSKQLQELFLGNESININSIRFADAKVDMSFPHPVS